MMIMLVTTALFVQTGDLKIKIDGKAGDITVFAADPNGDARLLANQIRAGFFMDPFGAKQDARVAMTDTGATLSVKPGTYHVRIRTDDAAGSADSSSGVWLTQLKVEAGKTLDAAVKIGAPGSVKGAWSVDKSAQSGNKLEGTTAALARDGKVWAFAKGGKGGAFEIKGVAPGTYSLVVSDMFEKFLSVTDNVSVAEGKESAVKVDVKRAGLGGVRAQFTDKAGKPAAPPKDVILVDERGRFAAESNAGGSTGDIEFIGWIWLPSGGGYILRAEGVERKSVTLKAPVIKGSGAFAEEIYETLKVPLGGGK